jgi:hypothetical protein
MFTSIKLSITLYNIVLLKRLEYQVPSRFSLQLLGDVAGHYVGRHD